jgi:hypothetical protein
VSLVAAELERREIPTVVLQLLKFATRKVRPPRAIFVPYPHGYPLASPHDAEAQHAVLEAALQLFEASHTSGPILVDYEP